MKIMSYITMTSVPALLGRWSQCPLKAGPVFLIAEMRWFCFGSLSPSRWLSQCYPASRGNIMVHFPRQGAAQQGIGTSNYLVLEGFGFRELARQKQGSSETKLKVFLQTDLGYDLENVSVVFVNH